MQASRAPYPVCFMLLNVPFRCDAVPFYVALCSCYACQCFTPVSITAPEREGILDRSRPSHSTPVPAYAHGIFLTTGPLPLFCSHVYLFVLG